MAQDDKDDQVTQLEPCGGESMSISDMEVTSNQTRSQSVGKQLVIRYSSFKFQALERNPEAAARGVEIDKRPDRAKEGGIKSLTQGETPSPLNLKCSRAGGEKVVWTCGRKIGLDSSATAVNSQQ